MKKVTLALVALFFSAACGSSDDGGSGGDDPTKDLVSLGAKSADSVSVELFADAPLHVGLSSIYYRLKREPGGDAVQSAAITQLPIMHMESMGKEHSCPHETPPPSADASGLFPALMVFQMASDGADTWRNELTIDLGDGTAAQSVVFENLEVAESSARKDLWIPDGSGGSKLVLVTLNFDAEPAVGQNPFTLTLHEKADMHGMQWQPMTDWTVVLTPNMPSMGHGSPDNVDPAHVASGRYEGSVNLTMTGVWTIAFDFSQGSTALGSVEYELEL